MIAGGTGIEDSDRAECAELLTRIVEALARRGLSVGARTDNSYGSQVSRVGGEYVTLSVQPERKRYSPLMIVVRYNTNQQNHRRGLPERWTPDRIESVAQDIAEECGRRVAEREKQAQVHARMAASQTAVDALHAKHGLSGYGSLRLSVSAMSGAIHFERTGALTPEQADALLAAAKQILGS